MGILTNTIRDLRKQRKRTMKELRRLDYALRILGSIDRIGVRGTRRRMSAAARRRISQAQKARWAAARKKKG
jgi:hypothetical protein